LKLVYIVTLQPRGGSLEYCGAVETTLQDLESVPLETLKLNLSINYIYKGATFL